MEGSRIPLRGCYEGPISQSTHVLYRLGCKGLRYLGFLRYPEQLRRTALELEGRVCGPQVEVPDTEAMDRVDILKQLLRGEHQSAPHSASEKLQKSVVDRPRDTVDADKPSAFLLLEDRNLPRCKELLIKSNVVRITTLDKHTVDNFPSNIIGFEISYFFIPIYSKKVLINKIYFIIHRVHLVGAEWL